MLALVRAEKTLLVHGQSSPVVHDSVFAPLLAMLPSERARSFDAEDAERARREERYEQGSKAHDAIARWVRADPGIEEREEAAAAALASHNSRLEMFAANEPALARLTNCVMLPVTDWTTVVFFFLHVADMWTPARIHPALRLAGVDWMSSFSPRTPDDSILQFYALPVACQLAIVSAFDRALFDSDAAKALIPL
jgi:hypothetical protein